MARSKRLRNSEVRGVCQLLGELGELWHAPEAWHRHLLRGAAALTGTQVATSLESGALARERPLTVAASVVVGWEGDPQAQRLHRDAERAGLTSRHPARDRAMEALRRRGRATGLRAHFVDDRTWYRSLFYQQLHRPLRRGDSMISLRLPRGWTGRAHMLAVNRMMGERGLDERARRTLSLLHDTTAPLIGARLSNLHQPDRAELTPRQREVLEHLLQGHSEKQIARLLCRSRATIHEHVVNLHRSFQISSRAELLARFIDQPPLDGRRDRCDND